MIATIYRPPSPRGTTGHPEGQPEVIRRDVPLLECTPVNGSETDIANQQIPTAVYRVKLYGDPDRLIKETDWLEVFGRRLEIAAILDPSLRQVGQMELTCGEIDGGSD